MNTLNAGFHIRTVDNQETDEQTTNQMNIQESTTNKNKISMLYTREACKDIMSPTDYRNCMRNLNPGQRQIVMYNRAWCKAATVALKQGKSINGYHIFLSGPGGTGKSHIIHLIRRDVIHFFQLTGIVEPDKPLVLLTAPTGSAAFQISGLTIHAALQLNSNNTAAMSYESKAILFNKLQQMKLMVIDEVSMVGSPRFRDINLRLCKIMHGDLRKYDFGGISMLLVGDLYQLPPVMQCPIFQNHKIKEPGDMAPSPWHTFMLHELGQIMRQKDIQFSNLLNVVRMKQPDHNSHEDQMLKAREIKVEPSHSDYPRHAMHVFATNAEAALWNENMLEDLQSEMFSYVADDSRKDRLANIAKIIFSDSPHETGNLLMILKVKVGARVMLTNNIDVTDGLTNGAMGTVTKVIINNNANKDKNLECILVQFDSNKVGRNAIANSSYRHLCDKSVPIKKIQVTFPVHGKESFQGSRTQFPIFLCWAVTIHKCQGLTVDEIVVDMKGRYNQGQAYVALSRVTTYEKLHIINYDQNKIKVSPSVETEMNRLRTNVLPPTPKPLIRNNTLTVVHINIRGLKYKLDDIQYDEDLLKADIICFSESWLCKSDKSADMLHISKIWSLFRCDRNSNGGGVMIAVKKQYKVKDLELQHGNLEIIGVQIDTPQPINIVCVYRHPGYNKMKFIHTLKETLTNCCGNPICLTGDLNENLLDTSHNTSIKNSLCEAGFIQHVKTPTIDTGSLLDHLYTLQICDIKTEVMDCYYSDHDFIYASISLQSIHTDSTSLS